MADFEKAVALVFKNEGGFVNDPDDTPTNWGITQAVYSAFVGRAASISDVRAMPKEVAAKIYKQSYWDVLCGDEIKSQAIADAFMDMGVLRGVSAASKTMQSIVNVTQDGVIGPKSIAAINFLARTGQNEQDLVQFFADECIVRFVAIAQANPKKLKFLMNWVRRAQRLT